MEARVTKVARVSARFLRSLARRRLRPNQEKVRGSTTRPFLSSLRLTIAMRSGGAYATAASTCQAFSLSHLPATAAPTMISPRHLE
jgi:hypothetical protein